MMCTVIDANASDDAPRAPNDSGVLVNLPRTRPQRSSARRVAARRAAGAAGAAGAANGDRTTRRDNGPGANAPRKTSRKPARTSVGESRAAAAVKASRGGAETMYPEYQKKLRQMTIPRPKVFDAKFAREHDKATEGKQP